MSRFLQVQLTGIKAIPTFKPPGSRIVCARRSSLTAWLAEREAGAREGKWTVHMAKKLPGTPIESRGKFVGSVLRLGPGRWRAHDVADDLLGTHPSKVDAEAAVLARHHAPMVQ